MVLQKNDSLETLQKNVENKNNKCNKCGICKKKLGLVPFTCRCGRDFCSIHRYETEHSCTFDHKNYGRQILEKDNQKIVADKLEKI